MDTCRTRGRRCRKRTKSSKRWRAMKKQEVSRMVREDPWRVERSPHPKTTSPWECGHIIESLNGCVTHSKLQCQNTTTKGSKSVLNIMSNWICWLTEEVCSPHLNKWLTAIISKDHSMFNFKTQQGKLIIEKFYLRHVCFPVFCCQPSIWNLKQLPELHFKHLLQERDIYK